MRMLEKLYNKVFMSSYFFTIAIRKRSQESIIESPEFEARLLLPATRKRWVADPILVDYKGNTYLFYEAMTGAKGRIEVVRINEDCSVTQPKIVLEDEFHYSYPFVFSYENEWYMIPESSACGEVRLYKASEFPEKWELVTVLLHQVSVDTTVFCYQGCWYLQTFRLCAGTEAVIPQIYSIDFNRKKPELKKIEWIEYDRLLCRGAGPWFADKGMLVRPAQENGENQYGNAVRFYTVEKIDEEYREKLVGRLTADQVKAKVWLDGLHTYTISERFEAIDIRIRKFDLFKAPRTLAVKFIQKLKR